jgi:hypothetical protein
VLADRLMELKTEGLSASDVDLAATALMCKLDKKTIAEWM